MSEKQEQHFPQISINLDFLTITLNSGFVLNAFYSALLLKKQSGVEITPAIEQGVLAEVLDHWAEIQSLVEKMPLKKAPSKEPGHQ